MDSFMRGPNVGPQNGRLSRSDDCDISEVTERSSASLLTRFVPQTGTTDVTVV